MILPLTVQSISQHKHCFHFHTGNGCMNQTPADELQMALNMLQVSEICR